MKTHPFFAIAYRFDKGSKNPFSVRPARLRARFTEKQIRLLGKKRINRMKRQRSTEINVRRGRCRNDLTGNRVRVSHFCGDLLQ